MSWNRESWYIILNFLIYIFQAKKQKQAKTSKRMSINKQETMKVRYLGGATTPTGTLKHKPKKVQEWWSHDKLYQIHSSLNVVLLKNKPCAWWGWWYGSWPITTTLTYNIHGSCHNTLPTKLSIKDTFNFKPLWLGSAWSKNKHPTLQDHITIQVHYRCI